MSQSSCIMVIHSRTATDIFGVYRTKKSTFIEVLEPFLGSTLSDSANNDNVRSAFKGDVHALRVSALSRSASFGASPDEQPATIDGASQVHASRPTEELPLPISEKQVHLAISHLQQEREEAQKQWKEQIAAIDEKITLLQARLAPSFEHSAGGHTGKPEGWAAPMPMKDIVPPSSGPQRSRPAAASQSNDQDWATRRKRRGVYLVRSSRKRATKRLHDNDDDDVTMTDAIDDLLFPSAVEAISAPSAPSLKQRLSQAFPARFSILTGKSRTPHKATGYAEPLPESLPSKLASQRPSSWPRTRRWRKSIGVSVRQLRENFEKLALESKDSTLPRLSK